MSNQLDSGSQSLQEFEDISERVSMSRVCDKGRANGNGNGIILLMFRKFGR